VTEIEIRDPAPEPAPEPATEGSRIVPLVVVPALIGMVLVALVAFFSTLTGKEDSPRENLDQLLHGGANEREQATFGLARQLLDFRVARAEGRAPEWDIDASLLGDVRNALSEIDARGAPEDLDRRFVLAGLMAELGDPDGIAHLAEIAATTSPADPGGEIRIQAVLALGNLAGEHGEAERELAARTLIGLLTDADDGLVLAASAGLQRLPGPETLAALGVLLDRPRLEQRVTAALSLAALGSKAGVPVLTEALAFEPYELERAGDPKKWQAPTVHESRRKALRALIDLGAAPGEAELARLAEEDPDPEMRSAARAALRGADGG